MEFPTRTRLARRTVPNPQGDMLPVKRRTRGKDDDKIESKRQKFYKVISPYKICHEMKQRD